MAKIKQLNNSTINAKEFIAPSDEAQELGNSLKFGHWILIVLGILCLLFIAFISIARSIQIDVVTLDINSQDKMVSVEAEVEILSLLQLPIANRTLVMPGNHQITVSADGFETNEQKLEIGSGRLQEYEVVLNPLAGQINIELLPDVFAKVTLDGKFFSGLPGLIENVPAGHHEMVVDAPLYRAVNKSIVVQGRNQTENISITLDPAWGELYVNSKPTRSVVLIDDEEVGETPFEMKIEEGTHTLSIKADKYKTFSQNFTIAKDQQLTVAEIELVPADAILDIQTEPSQAAIIVNGEYRGISPLALTIKPNQNQQLQLYKAGYKLQSQQLSLLPTQKKFHKSTLKQDFTAVRFSITPNDAELFIDGISRGKGGKTINLNTLPHKVSVRKKGFKTYQNSIIPTKTSSQVVSVRLLTNEQHFWSNIPNQYTNSIGQKMKLFKSPGTVKLGSSRRETGRRSNEVAYTANLNKHFYVSLNEVSNKQFREFKSTHNSGNYKRKSLDSNKHPVVNVSWQQAALFCNWMSKKEKLSPFYKTTSGYVSGNNVGANGYRLLTEVEWAWLARNKEDEVITYPWGNSPELADRKVIGNFADEKAVEFIAFTLANYNDGYTASSPIGRYPANHNGLYDIEGNVAEWVNDWYDSNSRYLSGEQASINDPLGPDEGEFHVIRGASWARGHLPQLRLAYRDFGAKGTHDVGFRIARYVANQN